jgi:hypothetical protein
VPIGTDAFVQSFVAKKCRDIIDDVEKLDAIQDGFIHFQLIRFCQATRFQYINSHIMLGNRCVLQHQHVDCKIADALLKKGTKPHADGWDASSKDWAHMVLHLPHAEGGFGVPFNCVTKDAAFYTTTSRFVACLLDGNPGTRVTGHPSPVTLVPGHFLYFFYIFFGELNFLRKKMEKNCVVSLFFLSFSLYFFLSLYTGVAYKL